MFLRRFLSTLTEDISRRKLKYLATKRGILENELIFEKFFETHGNALEKTDVTVLESLLNEYDWDIFAWITGKRPAPTVYADSKVFKLLQQQCFASNSNKRSQ